MLANDLIRREPERLIRSYQSAFTGELTLYGLGDDVRFYWAIPARQFCWTGLILVIEFIVAHLIGLQLPVFGLIVYYGAVSFSLGYVLSAARVEGRRLHVMLGAWFRHILDGHRTAGGYERLPSAGVKTYRPQNVRVCPAYEPWRPPYRYAVAALPPLALLVILLVLIGSGGASPAHHVTRLASSIAIVSRAVTTPTYVTPYRIVATRAPSKLAHRSVAHRPRVVRHHHSARHSAPRVIHRTRVNASPPVKASFAPPARTYAPPVVTHSAPPTPDPAPVHVASSPRPPVAPCYPGELGC